MTSGVSPSSRSLQQSETVLVVVDGVDVLVRVVAHLEGGTGRGDEVQRFVVSSSSRISCTSGLEVVAFIISRFAHGTIYVDARERRKEKENSSHMLFNQVDGYRLLQPFIIKECCWD